jgi:ADP-ribose pyrophosphatase YjhB (NUDIX family)
MPSFSHSAGGVVINSRGEVLIVNQRDASWSLPKGKINPGEDPRDAAMREIIEESGVRDLKLIKFLKSYSRYAMSNTGMEDTKKLKRMTMYLFSSTETELKPMDPRITEARWVPKEEVVNMLSHPKDQDFFESVLPELSVPMEKEPVEAGV